MTLPNSPRSNILLDTMPGDQVSQRFAPQLEIGKTGLRRVGGYVEEEFLAQLRGRKAVQVFREMADNDAITGAMLFAINNLLRQIEWRVEPPTTKAEDRANAEYIEQCMDDMSHSWSDLISEILSMNTFGWSFHEVVYKKRVGPWESSATRRSKYTDGKIGWRKIPIRAQETLLRWVFDEDGGIQAMVQMSPPSYQTKIIPISKALLFRTSSVKNNPEGRSLLRNAYRPWYLKKRIEEYEAIGVERDLAGLPVGRVPADYLNAPKGSDRAKMVDAFKQMVRSVRRDEQEGLVLPQAYDPDTKQPLFDFSLLTSGGTRQFDTSGIIGRYEQRILMCCLADFILVGHEGTGSYAMHTDKSGLFRTSINSIAQAIADVFNRHAIPKLFALNGMRPDELPKIVPNNVDPPDLTQLSGFMQAMGAAGVQWFPDPELEKFLRDAAQLPPLDEETEELREVQQRQANIMAVAQQRMDALNMEIQARQGAMGLQQQQMGVAQQQKELDAPPGTDPGDPDGAQAKTQAQQATAASGEKTNQARLATQQLKARSGHDQQVRQLQLRHERDRHQAQMRRDKDLHEMKLRQERAKLENMKKPPAKALPVKAAAKKDAPQRTPAPRNKDGRGSATRRGR